MIARAPVLQRLRAATASTHQTLDARCHILERLGSRADRRLLVAAYYRMHASVDAALAPWLAPIADLDHAGRLRTPLLEADLRALSMAVPSPSSLSRLSVSSLGEALGLLYVVEGSSLGGRTLRRALATAGADLDGLGFLDPYGDRTGERWRSFLVVLEREGSANPQAVERGARRGFERADHFLRLPETVR